MIHIGIMIYHLRINRKTLLRHDLRFMAILVLVLITLSACTIYPVTSSAPSDPLLLETPGLGTIDQANQAVALTQQQNNVDDQAIATAEIMRNNALATLNTANSTLAAAQTQQQNDANFIAAQVAATVEFERANAQATINAANSTQNAALTQDAIRATQAQFDLQSTIEQQNENEISANTQTAVANLITTQTRSAVATSQWYTDQARQREELRQGPIGFLWMWCFPIFLVLFAGLCLWGFWRSLKIIQNRQRIAQQPVERLPSSIDPDNAQDRFIPSEINIVNARFRPSEEPGDQINNWMDEIKGELSDQKEENDDNPGN
jgi:hypothetical protein